MIEFSLCVWQRFHKSASDDDDDDDDASRALLRKSITELGEMAMWNCIDVRRLTMSVKKSNL